MFSQLYLSINLQIVFALTLTIIILIIRNNIPFLLLAVSVPFTNLTISISAFYLTFSEFLACLILFQILLRFVFSNSLQLSRSKHTVDLLEVQAIQTDFYRATRLVLVLSLFFFLNLITYFRYPDLFALVQFSQRILYLGGGIIIGYEIYKLKIIKPVITAYLTGALGVSILYVFGFHPFGFAIMQKNVAGLLFGMAACCALYLFQTQKGYVILLIWFIFSMFVTQSRSALLGMSVVLLIFFARLNAHRFTIFISSTLAILAIWSLYVSESARDYLIFWDRDLYGRFDTPVQTRFLISERAIDLWKENPLFGYGFNPSTLDGMSTHNILTQSLIDGGILLGIMTLLLFLFASFFIYRFGDREIGLLIASVWTITVTHGLFDSYWTRNRVLFVWILVGFCLASAKDYSKFRSLHNLDS